MLNGARPRRMPLEAPAPVSRRAERTPWGVTGRKTLGRCLVAGYLLAAVSGDCAAGESGNSSVAEPGVEGSFGASKAAVLLRSTEAGAEADENSTDRLCDSLVQAA